MKISRILYSLLVASSFGFISCQNDELLSQQGEELVLEIVTPTNYSTRTSLAENGVSVEWNEGDAIAVYDFATTKKQFFAEITDGATRFKGNITPKYGNFVAVYPYELAAENDIAQKIVMHLPTEQTAVQDGFGPNLNLSIAKGQRNVDGSPSKVNFMNVCQLFKFQVPEYINNRIAKVELTASTPIAGQLTIDYSGDFPVVAVDANASKKISLLPPTGSSAFAVGTYYVLVAPEALNGFTLTFTDVDGKIYSQQSNSTIGGTSGFIYNLAVVDLIDKPQVTASHVYTDGVLQGTNLQVSAPASFTEWSAIVKNAQGVTVRTFQPAVGTLTSDNTDDNWPYLPVGAYTLEYTYTTSNGKQINTATSFDITEKPQFAVSLAANSTYSYYQAGNVDKANAMSATLVDGISATINGIAPQILNNANYSATGSNTFSAAQKGYANGVISYEDINITNLGANQLSASVTFDGVTRSASTEVYITGLPFDHQPPADALWDANNGQTSFKGDHVKTGAAGANGEFYFTGIQVPAGTRMSLAYKVDVYMDNLLSTQRYQISVGNDMVVNFTHDGTGTEKLDESKVFTSSGESKIVRCYTGYCYGSSNSKTYKIGLSYSK